MTQYIGICRSEDLYVLKIWNKNDQEALLFILWTKGILFLRCIVFELYQAVCKIIPNMSGTEKIGYEKLFGFLLVSSCNNLILTIDFSNKWTKGVALRVSSAQREWGRWRMYSKENCSGKKVLASSRGRCWLSNSQFKTRAAGQEREREPGHTSNRIVLLLLNHLSCCVNGIRLVKSNLFIVGRNVTI